MAAVKQVEAAVRDDELLSGGGEFEACVGEGLAGAVDGDGAGARASPYVSPFLILKRIEIAESRQCGPK